MLNVFQGTLVMLVRDKSIFIWSLAFPLILSTLFVFMFSHLDDAGQFEPVRTAVVANASYEEAPGFAEMIDALSQPGDDQMLDVVRVASEDEAVGLMRDTATGSSTATGGANEGVVGYLMVSDDGEPSVHVRGGATPDSVDSANQSILKVIVDNYLRSSPSSKTSHARIQRRLPTRRPSKSCSRCPTSRKRSTSRRIRPKSPCASTSPCWPWRPCSEGR